MARCLSDPREPAKVRHSLADIIRQRVFGLCCGYNDTNDVARIGHDPMQKLLLDRDPTHGDDLASQPTLSRFENNRRRVDLFRLGDTLALHSRKFFAAIPKLLARRYHYLVEQYYQPVSATDQSSVASLEIHQRLSREMQGLLLAEIEVRLLPVLGIIEALNAEADKNTYE